MSAWGTVDARGRASNSDLHLPSGYQRREFDALPRPISVSSGHALGDVPETFASALARLLGAERVIHLRSDVAGELPRLQGSPLGRASELEGSVVLCRGPLERSHEPLEILAALASALPRVQGILIETPDRDRVPGSSDLGPPGRADTSMEWSFDEFGTLLRSSGLAPLLQGYVGASSQFRSTQAAFVPGGAVSLTSAAIRPTAIAYVPCYNEADVILATVDRLLRQGVDVHVLDNWSKDGSWELLASRYSGDPRVSLERFPDAPSAAFEWALILERIDELAAAAPHGWILHVDADEQFDSCNVDWGLLDHLGAAQSSGYDVVDSTRIDFRPEEGAYHGEDAVDGSLPKRWEFSTVSGARVLERAWQNRRSRVGIADSGGHAVTVPKRVFPLNLVLRHYPIRSPEQARAKIFHDRLPRFERERSERGWHVHYDQFNHDSSFLWNAEDLHAWSWATPREWVAEFSTRAGLRFGGPDVEYTAAADAD